MHGRRTWSLAMHIYRATPLSSSLPASEELWNGRRYRTLLSTRRLMQNAHEQIVIEQMVSDKERSTAHYNKSARDLPPLPKQQKVYVQVDPRNQWTPATITQTPTAASQHHTLWRPRIEPIARGIGNSSDQLRKHPCQLKKETVSFPTTTSWSSPNKRSRDLRDL